MLFILLLLLSIKQATSFGVLQLDFVEQIIEESILKPQPSQGIVLLNAILLHTGLYSYCVFVAERGKVAFRNVKKIYARGRPRYTDLYLSDTKIRQLKFVFNWSDVEIKELKSRLKDNEYVMETFFTLVRKQKRPIRELRHFKRG